MNKLILQKEIEDRFSKKNIRTKVLNDIINSSKLETVFQDMVDLIKTYRKGNYYTSKCKRVKGIRPLLSYDIALEIFIAIIPSDGIQPIQSICSKLATLFNYENPFDAIKTASELLIVTCEANLFNVITASSSDTGSIMIQPNYSLEEDTIQFIENTKYLPPMICKPKEIVSNMSNGYLTKNESIILGKKNHHDGYQALDVLNITQSIKLSLDLDVLKLEEQPNKKLDTPEKVTNHIRFMLASRLVYNDIIESGNEFYLTYKYDKRGRIYSQGYHINMQGTSYKKASINLAQAHLITGE